jgi:hydrogenase expression/formation protein HypE
MARFLSLPLESEPVMKDDESIEMHGRMTIALSMIQDCTAVAGLIPEVRTNFIYTRSTPKDRNDVLAVEGRITVVGGRPHASGPLKFGGSSHMARFLIDVHKALPNARSAINFANDPKITAFLAKYCAAKGWSFCAIDRSHEPEEIKAEEGASVPWKAKEVLRLCAGREPKVAYENGAVGKEPVSVLIGADPIQVAEEICALAEAYQASARGVPKVGKIAVSEFESVIKNRLGAPNDKIIVPPQLGIDAGVIDVGGGQVMIVAEDPIFTMPGFPLDFFGWATVHIGASDIAVMGVAPQFMTYTLLMPPGTAAEDFDTIVKSIDAAAKELGIAIVGGHTGYYPGLATPIIGGITVFSFAKKGQYVTPAGAKPGDDVILTKGPAIEAAAALAVLRKKDLLSKNDPALVEKAIRLDKQMTVVKDALTAMSAGGVTAMHDATEGGVIGGLYEVASASGVGMEVDESKFIYPDEVRMVLEHVGLDPLPSIAEGSLILTAKPSSSKEILRRLKEAGIDASVIGKATALPKVRTIRRRDGRVVPLQVPDQDPFWLAFFESLKG